MKSLLVLLLLSPTAEAAAGMSASGFEQCVQGALSGHDQNECAEDSDSVYCVGLTRSLENFDRKQKCLNCAGYVQQDYRASEWVAIAAGHLGAFSECLSLRHGSEEDPTGLAAAQNDPQLALLLEITDDGAGFLGLKKGSIAKQLLAGMTFPEIIAKAPRAQEFSPEDLRLFRVSAANPMAVRALQEKELIAVPFRSPQRALAYQKAQGQLPAQPTPSRITAEASPYSLGLDLSLFQRVSRAYQRQGRNVREFMPQKKPLDVRDLIERGSTRF